MEPQKSFFDEKHVLHELKHYLPAQAPLKDFIHHNTLHAFQTEKFHAGLQKASEIFGYTVYQSLNEYRTLYESKKINETVLEKIISEKKGNENLVSWKWKLTEQDYDTELHQRIGKLRGHFKSNCKVNLDKEVHPLLFRLVGSYLDQGISIWKFPVSGKGFLDSLRALESKSYGSVFKSKLAQDFLFQTELTLSDALKILVGDERLFEHYLFDQQFAHPGWSGMVAVLEDNPASLLDRRSISLHDFILFEVLLEIDALINKLGNNWQPLASVINHTIEPLFSTIESRELFEIYALWQEAYEWTYYDQVLKGLQSPVTINTQTQPNFQALFCIDDRECSFRRYLEKIAPDCQTFGTAGFFNTEFYFQPEHGKFFTKVCPAPLTPGYLIKETEAGIRHKKDAHFSRHSQGLFGGWFISQTMGFWSMVKLAVSIFKPTETPAMVSSFKHMDPKGKLSVEAKNPVEKINELQLGYTVSEMTDRVEGLLKSIGLVKNFAPIVYIVGHGASSVNNTHYAGYDCGACSGRAGSANARVAAFMANHTEVRKQLKLRGIDIPETTQFLGALHDTTRDEIAFFDADALSKENLSLYLHNINLFKEALDKNAKERSRRFMLTATKGKASEIHEKVKLRSLSLFEPRPEWNHATNALCIVGRRETSKHLFLDRRAFLNSFDYNVDPDGKYLLGILRAVAPVCGGINLEYYFSRVDNYRLGAGTKLPHNVMGLIGVANGMDGDLRPGLPKQMIDIHDPVRLLVVVEHFPDVVLETIQQHPPTYEWFINEWVHLVVLHPENKSLHYFKNGTFTIYQSVAEKIEKATDLEKMFETTGENLPVYTLN
ncbi:MAG: YbcC family protein [Bacteroidia bacterium]